MVDLDEVLDLWDDVLSVRLTLLLDDNLLPERGGRVLAALIFSARERERSRNVSTS